MKDKKSKSNFNEIKDSRPPSVSPNSKAKTTLKTQPKSTVQQDEFSSKGTYPTVKLSEDFDELSIKELPFGSSNENRFNLITPSPDFSTKLVVNKESSFCSEKTENSSPTLDYVLPSMLSLSIDSDKKNPSPPGAPRFSRRVEDSEIDKENDPRTQIFSAFDPSEPNLDNSSVQTHSKSGAIQDSAHSSLKSNSVDEIADSLIDIMAPVVYEMDDRILAVKESQLQLQNLIKRLLEELNCYVDLAHPPKLQESINKLVGARRRLIAINSILNNVQERLDLIYCFMQGNSET